MNDAQNPILTTIDTMTYPINKIPFPSVVVCPPSAEEHNEGLGFTQKIMNHFDWNCNLQ